MISSGSLKKLSELAASGKNLSEMRETFRVISEFFKNQKLPQGTIVVYCSMAFNNRGAYWIQRSGEIRNPYYGAYMLSCGTITRKGIL